MNEQETTDTQRDNAKLDRDLGALERALPLGSGAHRGVGRAGWCRLSQVGALWAVVGWAIGCGGSGSGQEEGMGGASQDVDGSGRGSAGAHSGQGADFDADADDEVFGKRDDGEHSDVFEEGETRREEPFADLLKQPFRWEDFDFVIERATVESELVESELVESELWDIGTIDYDIVFELSATNRVNHEGRVSFDCDLVLADATRIESVRGFRVDAEPLATVTERLRFDDVPDQFDLAGAHLELHEGDLTDVAPLHIPLDAPLDTPYPIAVDALNDQVFETADPVAFQRARVEVLDAQIDQNSDLDGGLRAPYGKKFLDLLLRVRMLPDSKSGNMNFGTGNLYVYENGYLAPIHGRGDLLNRGAAPEELRFVVELNEDTTEFEFRFRLDDEQRESVLVELPE